MIRFLTIGDLHAQIGNLEDTELILKELVNIAANPENRIDVVVFLGDLFHTHSVVRQEVAALLRKYVPLIRGRSSRPTVLVGNHDLVGPTNTSLNAVDLIFGDSVQVVGLPQTIFTGIAVGVPFTPDNEVFVQRCQKSKNFPLLFCHQTFASSQYENGFYAPGGVDANLIPQKCVISGHIHKRQTIGKVFYVGTPRALTASDVNEVKGVDIIEYDEEKGTATNQFIPLNGVAKAYYQFHLNENEPIVWPNVTFKEKDDVTFHAHGSKEFCNQMQDAVNELKLTAKVRVASDVTQKAQKQLSIESAGMTVEDALKKYVFEIADVDSGLKEGVWKTIQSSML